MNTGKEPLKLYTLYAPAEFKPGTVEKVKPK
jgi:mannose-6-phosphate isomerase-like protein (cupin superfamily)